MIVGLEKERKEKERKEREKKEGRSREKKKKPSSNAYAALDACALLLGIPIIFLGITADNTVFHGTFQWRAMRTRKRKTSPSVRCISDKPVKFSWNSV